MQHTRRYQLKKYRGLLLAQITDCYNLHETLVPKHTAGTKPEVCDICKQIFDQNAEVKALGILIERERVPQSMNKKSRYAQRKYYYRCEQAEFPRCLIRAYNRQQAREFYTAKYQRARVPEISHPIGAERVYQYLVRYVEQGNEITRFLRRKIDYVGIVTVEQEVKEPATAVNLLSYSKINSMTMGLPL